MSPLTRFLSHPLTQGFNLDDPSITALRRQILKTKPFLYQIYKEWYALILAALPATKGEVIEIGAGAGFLKQVFPDIIDVEAFYSPAFSLIADACALPLADKSLRAIVMTDVLHHIATPRRFFAEATRCIRSGGVIAMIEPWVNRWATFIYTHLHHESFLPDAAAWELPKGGLLSTANGAMPWIILQRDRAQFHKEFPEWEITRIEPFMPLRYLASGGLSRRSLMPGWSFPFWKILEQPFQRYTGMFAYIVLTRR